MIGQRLVRPIAVRLGRHEVEIGADLGAPVAGERPIDRHCADAIRETRQAQWLGRLGVGKVGGTECQRVAEGRGLFRRERRLLLRIGVVVPFAGGSGASTTEPRASCAAAGAAVSAHAKATVVHAAQIVAHFRIPNISPDPPDRNVPAHGRRRPVKHWLPCLRELWRRCEAPKSQ
jgi:hypothetical protein